MLTILMFNVVGSIIAKQSGKMLMSHIVSAPRVVKKESVQFIPVVVYKEL